MHICSIFRAKAFVNSFWAQRLGPWPFLSSKINMKLIVQQTFADHESKTVRVGLDQIQLVGLRWAEKHPVVARISP
jgi:hypothetical protein